MTPVNVAINSQKTALHRTGEATDFLPLSIPKVDIVEKILHSFNVWPECMLCPNGVGFADHVPAEKHLRSLWERLPQGKPIVAWRRGWRCKV